MSSRAEGASANPQVHNRGNQSGWITHGGIFALHGGEEVNCLLFAQRVADTVDDGR